MILEIVQARAAVHVHLTPSEMHALWRITQAIGRAFWHMTTWVQVALVGVPGLYGMWWMHRWNPLQSAKK